MLCQPRFRPLQNTGTNNSHFTSNRQPLVKSDCVECAKHETDVRRSHSSTTSGYSVPKVAQKCGNGKFLMQNSLTAFGNSLSMSYTHAMLARTHTHPTIPSNALHHVTMEIRAGNLHEKPCDFIRTFRRKCGLLQLQCAVHE